MCDFAVGVGRIGWCNEQKLAGGGSLLGVSVDIMSFNLFSLVDWLWLLKDVGVHWSVYLFIAWQH